MSRSRLRSTKPAALRPLDQLMRAPDVGHAVRQADPRLLHQVMRAVGTDEAVGLLQLASPAQIARIFDLDVWTHRPGQADRFDPERFGEWVVALVEEDIALALRILRELGVAFATAALSQHIAVCSRSTAEQRGLVDSAVSHEIGALVVVARQPEAFHAIVAVLEHARAEAGAFFDDVMAECRQLSYEHLEEESGFDVLLTRREQALADLAFARQRRLEADGYVTRDEAVAFLTRARAPHPVSDADDPDPIARAYFRDKPTADLNAPVDSTPVAHAHDRGEPRSQGSGLMLDLLATHWRGRSDVAARNALPGREPETAAMYAALAGHVRGCAGDDPAAGDRIGQELAFLSGVLLEGGQVHDRSFTVAEAGDAAAAICNLGLELRAIEPTRSPRAPRLAASAGDGRLIEAFRAGWRQLHWALCVQAAQTLLQVLASVSARGNDQIEDLQVLRRSLMKALDRGEPWLARPALETIAVLDTEAWVNLRHFINACPVVPRDCMHPRSDRADRLHVHPDAFAFVSTLAQVQWAESYLASLRAHLGL